MSMFFAENLAAIQSQHTKVSYLEAGSPNAKCMQRKLDWQMKCLTVFSSVFTGITMKCFGGEFESILDQAVLRRSAS